MKCPFCNRNVLNRNFPKCEFCHNALPPELLRTNSERDRIFSDSEKRAVELRAKEIEREKNRDSYSPDVGGIDPSSYI